MKQARSIADIRQMIEALQVELEGAEKAAAEKQKRSGFFRTYTPTSANGSRQLAGPDVETGSYAKAIDGTVFRFTLSGMSDKRAQELADRLNDYLMAVIRQDWFKEQYIDETGNDSFL
jgi:hypothetical protein